MRKNEDHFQSLGICHRFFNFVMNSLIGVSLKRVTLGHPMPRGSTDEAQADEHAKNEVPEPLISQAKPKDDSDSMVRVNFKQTEEEMECWNWTHVDKIGSSYHVAEIDDENKASEKRDEFIDISPSRNKANPVLNGASLDTNIPQVNEKRGKNIIIPITDSAGTKSGKRVQPDGSKPVLTGLGLNINEVSETFIQNTKERMIRNVSLME